MNSIHKNKFRELARRNIFTGRIFKLDSVRMKGPAGRQFEHQVVTHPGAAVIVPVLDSDHFVLVRQYRTSLHKVLWEFPAGTLEKWENPLSCAKREIEEEIGFRARKWAKLGSFYPAPGMSTEHMHLFLARDLEPVPGALETDEFLVRRIVSRRRLKRMIESGRIKDAKTVLGFFYYEQYRKRRERN